MTENSEVAVESVRELTIDEARGLAKRWAAANEVPSRFDPEVLDDIRSQLESGSLRFVGANPANSTNAAPHEAAREALNGYERGALLGWVRRRMAVLGSGPRAEHWEFDLAQELGLGGADIRPLCEQAGWPS